MLWPTFWPTNRPGTWSNLEPGFALVGVFELCVREDGYQLAAAPRDIAGAIARTAFSHYIFPENDPAATLRQIRAAAGLGEREK